MLLDFSWTTFVETAVYPKRFPRKLVFSTASEVFRPHLAEIFRGIDIPRSQTHLRSSLGTELVTGRNSHLQGRGVMEVFGYNSKISGVF